MFSSKQQWVIYQKGMYNYFEGGHKNLEIHDNIFQCSHRLEKYFNLEGFLGKSLKIKSALKSTGKSLQSLEKSLNSTIFCRTKHC